MNGHAYPRYARYKNSDVGWLGQIPVGWEVAPLFLLLRERFVRNAGNREQNVLSLSYGRIVPRDVESNFGLLPDSFETYQVVEPGNIVLRLTDLQNDKRSLRVGHVGQRGIVTSAYVNLESAEGIDNRFAFYLLNAYDLLKVFYGMGAGVRQTMKFDDLKRMPCVVPAVAEQKAIAAFLDRETAKIDALIEKQERLIGLLEAKRKAVISHAVTQGLDPNARMKDSGIEWLGRIPKHWGRAQLRRFAQFVTSGSRGWAAHYSESGAIFLRIGNLTRNSIGIDLSDVQRVEPPVGTEGERTRIRAGDVLFSITAYLGSVAVAPDEMGGAYVSQHIALVRLNREAVSSEYVGYTALADMGQNQLAGQAYGGTKVQLALGDVKCLWIPVPPMDEQNAIVIRLAVETRNLDGLITRVEQLIGMLREKRTALISAAVTGKIDVREAV